MLRTIVIIMFLASGCEEQALRDQNRPAEDTEEVIGYIAVSSNSKPRVIVQ